MSELHHKPTEIQCELDDFGSIVDGDQQFFNRAKRMRRLDDEELTKYTYFAQQGEVESLQKVVETNIMLVARFALRVSRGRRLMEQNDLIQEGIFGLIDAAEKFDSTYGPSFPQFAPTYIRKSLQRAIRYQDGAFPLSQGQYELSVKKERIWAELAQQLGREPSDQELAEACNVKVDKVKDLKDLDQLKPTSYNTEYSEASGRDGDWCDVIADTAGHDSVHDTVEYSQLQDTVAEMLGELDEFHATILRLRFGFDGDPLSRSEVARQLGVTPDKIRHHETTLLKQLKTRIHPDGYRIDKID